MNARRGLAVVLAFALLVPASLAVAGPAAAATTTRVVEFNTADGKACQSRCLAPLVGLLGANVDLITLQEVCQNDLASFATAHGLHATFSAQSTADTVCHGADRGNAVLSQWPLDPIPAYRLDAPHTTTTNVFTLLCAIVHKPGQRLRGCSTHLVAGDSPDQAGQVKQILADTAGARNAGQKVIVAGDFNLMPGDAAIAPMNKGFSQKRPSNTKGVKVEYVWFHSSNLSAVTATRYDGGTSDHDILQSSAGV